MSSNLPDEKLQIGRALLASGPITQEQLQSELDKSGKNDSVLGKALLNAGFPREEELAYVLLSRLRIPRINARNTKIPLETVRVIPKEIATRHRVLALDELGEILVVVTPDSSNSPGLAELRRAVGRPVFPIQSDTKSCTAAEFEDIVREYYDKLSGAGLTPAQAMQPGSSPSLAAAGANGAVTAIPVGSAGEDRFYRLFMSHGPVPALER